jgi:DNA-binding Xre family transcriptional regulator
LIRFRLQELMSEMQFKEGRRITLLEVAEKTGINRMTLSRMSNRKGYSTVTNNIDKLCAFFTCEVGEVMEVVRDRED